MEPLFAAIDKMTIRELKRLTMRINHILEDRRRK